MFQTIFATSYRATSTGRYSPFNPIDWNRRRRATVGPASRRYLMTTTPTLGDHYAGVSAMWRSLFLAAGITCCILGTECFLMEKAVLRTDLPAAQTRNALFATPGAAANEFVPPEWAPWTLLSVGAVVIIYSYSIPRRNGG
jgi:hypothetical protein